MVQIYNFDKVKLCYRTYWKRWLTLLAICLLIFACSSDDANEIVDPEPVCPVDAIDSDGDGVCDDLDAFPVNGMEWADTDGDGIGDNNDAFPDDPSESVDSDGDGVGDNSDNCPLVSGTVANNGC